MTIALGTERDQHAIYGGQQRLSATTPAMDAGSRRSLRRPYLQSDGPKARVHLRQLLVFHRFSNFLSKFSGLLLRFECGRVGPISRIRGGREAPASRDRCVDNPLFRDAHFEHRLATSLEKRSTVR